MDTLHDLYIEIDYERDYQPDPPYTPSRLPAPPPTPKPQAVLTTAERAELEAWFDMVDAQAVAA